MPSAVGPAKNVTEPVGAGLALVVVTLAVSTTGLRTTALDAEDASVTDVGNSVASQAETSFAASTVPRPVTGS